MRRLTVVSVVALLATIAAACGSNEPGNGAPTGFPDGSFAVNASSDVAVGSNRLLIGVALPDGTRLGSPDEPVSFAIEPLDGHAGAATVPARFLWIVDDAVGLYEATVDVDAPGPWSVTVLPADGAQIQSTAFQVAERSATPAVGDAAVAVATPTTSDRPMDELTTDTDPDPRFYRVSLDEALRSGKPTVVVFATPAFCQTASCGPMLDNTKSVADRHPEVNFVHVEVYEGFRREGFVPNADHLSPAVVAWNLPSEPWVFVVDGAGIVAAKFEGVLDPGELEDALANLER